MNTARTPARRKPNALLPFTASASKVSPASMAPPAPVELPAPAPIEARLTGVDGLAKPLADAMSYSVDLLQRSLLFMDVLRQRFAQLYGAA